MRRLLEVFLKSNSSKGKVRSELSEDTTGKPIESEEVSEKKKGQNQKTLLQVAVNLWFR